MSIKATEVGKTVRLAAGFDMSGKTSVTITSTNSSGTAVTIADSRITIPNSAYSDPALGTIAANEYAQFSTSATDFLTADTYSLYITYNDTTNSKIYYSDAANLVVAAKGS